MTVFWCWKLTVFLVLENDRFSVLEKWPASHLNRSISLDLFLAVEPGQLSNAQNYREWRGHRWQPAQMVTADSFLHTTWIQRVEFYWIPIYQIQFRILQDIIWILYHEHSWTRCATYKALATSPSMKKAEDLESGEQIHGFPEGTVWCMLLGPFCLKLVDKIQSLLFSHHHWLLHSNALVWK